MTAAPVVTVYESVQFVFMRGLEGISDEESRITPVANANSINWIAGHIVATRIKLFRFLALDYTPPDWLSSYTRGNAPATPDNAASIGEIAAEFARTYTLVMDYLQSHNVHREEGEEMLAKIAWYGFHESYHCGQIGMLRKALGKEPIVT